MYVSKLCIEEGKKKVKGEIFHINYTELIDYIIEIY